MGRVCLQCYFDGTHLKCWIGNSTPSSVLTLFSPSSKKKGNTNALHLKINAVLCFPRAAAGGVCVSSALTLLMVADVFPRCGQWAQWGCGWTVSPFPTLMLL